MAGNYTVQQGDYLSKIAKENGFPDYHTIWDHPNNAQLKQQRQNPNVLFPGDQLFMPDMEQRQESGATDQRHTFVTTKGALKLRLVLEDIYEQPIAGAACTLVVQGQGYPVTSDSSGKIEQAIPATAQDGFLVITADQTPFQNVQIPLKIGSLDPVDQVSGQIARLNNLGYFAGKIGVAQGGVGGESESDVGDGGDADETSGPGAQGSNDQFSSAVEEFQCDQGLTVDGICGPITQAKLKQVHGC
ncbi:MAG: PGRP and LysM peptidoglycan-binding domain-containing protein [Terriglobia bacterium]